MKGTENLPAMNAQRMSSLEIAEVTGKPHNDVLKAIRKMEPAWAKVTQGNFSLSAYQDTTGRTLPCYALTKVECLYIATKFNYEGLGLTQDRLFIYYSKDGKKKERTYLVRTPKGAEMIGKMVNPRAGRKLKVN